MHSGASAPGSEQKGGGRSEPAQARVARARGDIAS